MTCWRSFRSSAVVDRGLIKFLRDRERDGCLSLAAGREAAKRFNLKLQRVEEAGLGLGLMPERFRRNRPFLSCFDQLELLRSTVAVIGCGGLGGYVLEELARAGVGTLLAMDPDRYEEHNLNRQLQADAGVLGRPKVEVIGRRLARINPALEFIPLQRRFSRPEPPLDRARVIVDALDNIGDRKTAASACRQLRIPMVHGAVEGWYGQVAVLQPDRDAFAQLYPRNREKQASGVLSFTVAAVASLQAAATVTLLLGRDSPLATHCLTLDLLNGEYEKIPL